MDCGQRLFLFPNNYSRAKAAGTIPEDLLDTQVDPAAFEMAGHLILKRKEDYDAISQVRQRDKTLNHSTVANSPKRLFTAGHLDHCVHRSLASLDYCNQNTSVIQADALE